MSVDSFETPHEEPPYLREQLSESFEDIYDEKLYCHEIFDDVEDCEEYRPGGFHPVHLGDYLGTDNRFRAIDKLGSGGSATLWLCRDCEKNTYVALKIIIADASDEGCSELKLVRRIDLDFDQPGGRHIALPLDHFWIQGPNGSHLCLVFPVLGPRGPVISSTLLDPSKTARDICLQVTNGLQFLHRNGICHGDFRPSNILLRLSDLDSLSEEQLTMQLGEPRMQELFTVSGETPGPSGPRYLVRPANLEALDPRHFTDQACIIDFGEAYDSSSPPEGLGIPLDYCSPELIFNSLVGVKADIWALACTIFELRFMGKLFETFSGDDDEVILQMVRLLGKLPESWWASWGSRHRWFDEDGSPKTGKALAKPYTLEERLGLGVHYGVDAMAQPINIAIPPEERRVLENLLLQMLRYDPQSRPSVESVLDHLWFKP